MCVRLMVGVKVGGWGAEKWTTSREDKKSGRMSWDSWGRAKKWTEHLGVGGEVDGKSTFSPHAPTRIHPHLSPSTCLQVRGLQPA